MIGHAALEPLRGGRSRLHPAVGRGHLLLQGGRGLRARPDLFLEGGERLRARFGRLLDGGETAREIRQAPMRPPAFSGAAAGGGRLSASCACWAPRSARARVVPSWSASALVSAARADTRLSSGARFGAAAMRCSICASRAPLSPGRHQVCVRARAPAPMSPPMSPAVEERGNARAAARRLGLRRAMRRQAGRALRRRDAGRASRRPSGSPRRASAAAARARILRSGQPTRSRRCAGSRTKPARTKSGSDQVGSDDAGSDDAGSGEAGSWTGASATGSVRTSVADRSIVAGSRR